MKEIVLKVEQLSYQYENQPVLQNISFDLRRGEMMGLIGPNGSGKSTLLKVILGVLPMQTGTIEWFGQSIGSFKDNSNIGYVSQKANSFNTGFPATAEEVVMMGLTAKLGLFHRPRKKEKELVAQALDSVGMIDYATKNIGRLSGGQQQRIFIARAIVGKPEVLMLDEPTVGVDSASESQFFGLIHKLNQEMELSMILVSHDLGGISMKMNTIACLNQRLHFHGNADDFDRVKSDIIHGSFDHDGLLQKRGTPFS